MGIIMKSVIYKQKKTFFKDKIQDVFKHNALYLCLADNTSVL